MVAQLTCGSGSGSRKADLHQLALLVFQICLKFSISLEAKWIPRDLNATADAINKLIDHDDYTIKGATSRYFDLFLPWTKLPLN